MSRDDDGVEEELKRVRKLVERNNILLEKMQAAQRRAALMRLVYWVVVIGVAVVAYIYIEPYIDQLGEMYANVQQAADEAGGFFDDLPLEEIREQNTQ